MSRHNDVRRGGSDWADLEEVTNRVLAKGVFRHNAELPTLMRLHRRAASSLATARAMAAEPRLLAYLESLVTRSHLALHGSTAPRRDSIARYVMSRIPAAIGRFRVELAIAAALLLFGLALGWLLVALERAWFFSVIDSDWIAIGSVADRTSTLRARLSADATWRPQSLGLGWAGCVAFGLGLAGGIPTAIALLCAGMGLGASAGLYAQRGMLAEFAAWFLPHAVPGLAAVVLCGGVGLALGRAVLFPRRDLRLGQVARELTPLLIGAGALFGIALAVERILSPVGLGLVVGVFELVGLAAWITRGMSTASVDPVEAPPVRSRVEVERPNLHLRFDGPEIADLRVTLASLGERAIALAIDLSFIALIYAGCSLVFGLPPTDWVLVLVVGFGLRHAAFFAFESRWQGATPGKRLMRLRVMARDGRTLDQRSLLLRNLLRDAELVAGVLLVGLVDGLSPHGPLPEAWPLIVAAAAGVLAVPLLDRERRRLGDLVGDTIVIRVPSIPQLPWDAVQADDPDALFDREQLGIYGAHEVERLAELLDGLVVQSEASADVTTEVARTIAERIGVDPARIGDPERFLRRFYRAQRARLERNNLRGRSSRSDSG